LNTKQTRNSPLMMLKVTSRG